MTRHLGNEGDMSGLSTRDSSATSNGLEDEEEEEIKEIYRIKLNN